jgi:hypothetical protein
MTRMEDGPHAAGDISFECGLPVNTPSRMSATLAAECVVDLTLMKLDAGILT